MLVAKNKIRSKGAGIPLKRHIGKKNVTQRHQFSKSPVNPMMAGQV